MLSKTESQRCFHNACLYTIHNFKELEFKCSHFQTFSSKTLEFLIVKSPVFIYTGGSLFKTFVQIVANFTILAYIPPEYMGIWNSFILFQNFVVNLVYI